MRVTDSDVKEILSTTLDTTPFIQVASVLLDTYLGAAAVPFAVAREMERWWAAHLVCIREPRVQQKRLGDTVVTYAKSALGAGLESTEYGQMVLQLDPTGALAESGYKRAWIKVD